MAKQYLLICEETTRGTKPASPNWLPLPSVDKLQPSFSPKDEPRKGFRGADTALGDSSVVRRESQWTLSVSLPWYPIAAIALLFKHLFGHAAAGSVLETTAYERLFYPLAMPYGAGYPLVNKAIGVSMNSDEGGATLSQYYGGGRVKSCSIAFKGTDDVKLTFEIQGPGEYVGAADQTAVAEPDWSTLPSPFVSADALFYVGAGISRTGTAPDFTALAAGTMTAFQPDDMTVKLTNGLDDKVVMNGVKGPSKTHRAGQFAAEADCTIDYLDPSSGFSSADEFKRLFAAPAEQSLLVLLDNGELAGDTSENYQAVIDLARLMLSADVPDRNPDGKQPQIKFKYASLFDDTAEYPAALQTVDKTASA